MKKILLSLSALALLVSCQNELYRDNVKEYESKQGVYMSNASAQVFAEAGAADKEVRDLTLSLARKPETPYVAKVKVGDAAALEAYNKRNGTEHKLLSPEMYEAASEVTFPANTATVSYPIKLKNLKFEPGVVYAIPVTIVDDCAIPGQESAVVTVDPLTITKVGRFGGSGASKGDMWPEFMKLKQWTLEGMINRTAYRLNNQALFGTDKTANGAVDEIYPRFGDVTIDHDQLQLKTASTNLDVPKSEFSAKPNEWYMVSMVYDGVFNSIYINGKLVLSKIVRENNEYGFKGFWIGGVNHLIREVRFYNEAKTAQQIAAGVWKTANYNDPSLFLYYPLNGKKLDRTTGQITDDESKIWDWSASGMHLDKPSGFSFQNDSNGDPYVFPVGVR